MKIVGILTYHFVYNYGANLQAFALKNYLSKLKLDAVILNYVPNSIWRDYHTSIEELLKHPKKELGKIKRNFKCQKQNHQFDIFMKELTNGADKFHVFQQIKPFDFYITGSDQVWNPHISNFDKNYFCKFSENKNIHISYAASIGIDHIEGIESEFLLQNIKNISKIGVREKSLQEFFARESIESTLVCDPTLLLKKEDWILEENQNYKMKEPFVLVYLLEQNEVVIREALEEAKKIQGRVIGIHPFGNLYHSEIETLLDVGPREFLSLIHQATMVFTNSYHGLLFSLIYEKEIGFASRKLLNSRSETIISMLQLKSMKEIICDDLRVLRYYKITKENQMLLNQFRESSQTFLKNSLEE